MRQQAITIHRPTWGTDSHGSSTITGWTDITTRGRVRPTSGREVTAEGQRTIVDATGVLAPTEAAEATDELTAGGRRYRVLGAFLVESETGTLDHYHLDLQAVS